MGWNAEGADAGAQAVNPNAAPKASQLRLWPIVVSVMKRLIEMYFTMLN